MGCLQVPNAVCRLYQNLDVNFESLSEAKQQVFWCKTKHKIVKLRVPKARHVAVASQNSERTLTWMITECSNGDVQVLRTVKNGVSTASCDSW